jgi:hypothetical protein
VTAFTSVSAVAIIMVVLALVAWSKAEKARKNEDEATKQRDKARARFKLAREAVDKFHTQVSESPEVATSKQFFLRGQDICRKPSPPALPGRLPRRPR